METSSLVKNCSSSVCGREWSASSVRLFPLRSACVCGVVWVVWVCGGLRSVVRIIIQSTYRLFLGTIEAGQFCGPNKVLLCLRNFVSGFEV